MRNFHLGKEDSYVCLKYRREEEEMIEDIHTHFNIEKKVSLISSEEY